MVRAHKASREELNRALGYCPFTKNELQQFCHFLQIDGRQYGELC